MGTTLLVVMAAAYAAGALFAAFAPTPRLARAATALGAAIGAAAGLAAALTVLATGDPIRLALPALVGEAGGILIQLDRLGALFLALVCAVGLPSAVYGIAYTAAYDGRRSLGTFGVVFNGFLLGMCLVPGAANVFTFLLAWELMAVTSYALVMTESDEAATREAGLWYAAMTHAGFVLLLPMFFLMAPSASATAFADLRTGAAALSPVARDVVFLLALLAFGSKAGIVPLHVWLPRAHPAAPSHVSALMSGVMIKLGIYGLLRVSLDLLGTGPAWWGGVVLLAGSASALGGILYALTENDLKRLLAYSSVENVGVILLGVGAGLIFQGYGLHALAGVAFAAALFHTINHGVFKSLLFLATGNVVHGTGTRNLERMGGLVKRMPQTAALFLVGAVAAAALPPLNGFASEWLIFQALLSGAHIPQAEVAVGTPLAIGVLALTGGLAALTFVKAFGIGFLAMPRSPEAAAAHDGHWSTRVAMLVPAAGCVGLGLFAPHAVHGLLAVVGQFTATAPATAAAAPMWITAPGATARVSPLLVAVVLGAVMTAALVFVRLRGLAVRRTDTWGCGRIRQTPRMEYTSSAFAEPLRRVFSELYRPAEDLAVTAHPDSPLFVRSITYTTRMSPWIEQALYDPLTRATRSAGTAVRRLQAGSIHLYLLYVGAALVLALASAWWLR